jgi:hypothetical protein
VAEADLVRTWAWRGTLHLLAREDVSWALSLVAEPAARAVRARRRSLGLDDAVQAAAEAVLDEALAAGPRTRDELRAALAAAGIDASGQRLPHLLRQAALAGRLAAGPAETYAALGPLPAPPPREAALRELGRRYVAAYGPATADDLRAWSGLPAADVRAAWAGVEPRAAEEAAPGEPVVRLLPAFDTYLLGYRSREHAVAAEHASRVWPGGGWIHPVVLVDGRAAGTWRVRGGRVAVEPFGPLPDGARAEAADVERFLSG